MRKEFIKCTYIFILISSSETSGKKKVAYLQLPGTRNNRK